MEEEDAGAKLETMQDCSDSLGDNQLQQPIMMEIDMVDSLEVEEESDSKSNLLEKLEEKEQDIVHLSTKLKFRKEEVSVF
eukprot:Awhi_evm1s11928